MANFLGGLLKGGSSMKVFIADHGSDVVDYLKKIIEDLGYIAVGCTDSNALTEILLREVFDLVILDWNIRGSDGGSLLEWMNTTLLTRPPVIMMANRSAKRDITDALNAGADDYITKPESRNVIAARINALLRGNAVGGAFDTEVTYGAYKMNRLEQSVTIHGETVILTAKEFELAEMFFKNTDRTLSRHYIMQTIWRTTAKLATRTLDMHISRMRAKLALRPENGFRIFTVFGYGYRLETAQ
jgi:DNA-binding response OmpR family regulator